MSSIFGVYYILFHIIVTGMFSLRFVCPSVRVSVCPCVPESVCPSECDQDNSKTAGRIFLKFGRHVGIVKSKRWHDFGGDPE